MFIKAKEKQSKKWKQYIKHACDKNTSSILLPKYTLLYSRNNVNWYSSFEESFSEKQLENIKIYEKEIIKKVNSLILGYLYIKYLRLVLLKEKSNQIKMPFSVKKKYDN